MERWRVNLYTLWCVQIISLMSFGFGVPFLPYYIQELGVTDPDKLKIYTGILNAAPAITLAIMAPIWGVLSDKYGKKLMLLRSMLCASFIIGGMGLATCAEHLIILRLAQGLFTGTVTASSALVASNTPDNRLSYALGFLSSSTFIGFSIGPVIGGFIAEYVGYRVSFFIGAALMMLDFIVVMFVVTEGKKPESVARENKKEAIPLVHMFTILISTMLALLFFSRVARTVFGSYIPLYVQEIRASMEGAAGVTGIIGGVTGFMTALAGITISRLGDKYNKKNIIMVLIISGIIISLPLVLLNNLWFFTAVYGMLFFAMGGLEPLIMSVTSENTPAERRGTLFGIQTLVGSAGWAVSPLLGSFVSIKFNLRTVLVLIPISLLFALIIALPVKIKKEIPCDTN